MSTATTQPYDATRPEWRYTLSKTRLSLAQLCQSDHVDVDISRLDELKKNLSFNVDHAESCMRFLRTERAARPLLSLLQQAINSAGVVTELPDIRKLCLARMMELTVRIEDLPRSMRIDDDVRPVSRTVLYVARGGFGYIYRTKLRSNNTLVAVKVPKEEVQEKKKTIFREILLWSHLRHDNILPFKGVCEFQGKFPSIVSPWMTRGTVTEYCGAGGSYLSVKFTLLGHVASALDYLHSHDPQIIHEDVRGANILVNDLGNAVLSDFGISRINSEAFADMSSRLQHGNIRWSAPELLFETEGRAPPKPRSERDISETETSFTKASTHSDMWSFAMTIIEVLTGEVPFADAVGRFDAAVVLHIYDRKLPRRPAVGNVDGVGLPDSLWEAIERCWDDEPDGRPSASEMLAHLKNARKASEVDVQLREEPITYGDAFTEEPVTVYSSATPVRG